ncbi:hypothetical protein M440DRAFT_1394941 [Trichoderma longibrachiatum ATCC 18648]|uniref:Secreted protein n=1 Tax=Trichoderma longibrachiatum ATCC 18648 TaxID=983965 RepID=A0A2T4BSI8_TRILO|nr:hypothetical protein M440DRAFT_1394941 [Trichoderma longibrachiatum ATCC 18648]
MGHLQVVIWLAGVRWCCSLANSSRHTGLFVCLWLELVHCRQPLRWKSRRLNMLYLMQPVCSHGLMATIGRCKKAYPCKTLWAWAARPRCCLWKTFGLECTK